MHVVIRSQPDHNPYSTLRKHQAYSTLNEHLNQTFEQPYPTRTHIEYSISTTE